RAIFGQRMLVPDERILELSQIRVRPTLRRQSGDLRLDRLTGLEKLLRQASSERRAYLPWSLAILGGAGDEDSLAVVDFDGTNQPEAVEGFANGRASDAETLDDFPLGRKARARRKLLPVDLRQQLLSDPLDQGLPARGAKLERCG